MVTSRISYALLLTAAPVLAQSNAVPGTDVNLYDVSSPTIYGRRGPAYPNGEVGVGFGHAFCNAGTVHVPWQSSPTTSGQMTDVHFKIAFLVARESNGRMVQISSKDSYVKHSRVTYNLGSSQCGTCQSGPGSTFRIGCYDAYSTGFNGDRFNLGPSTEIDPWLGSWNPVGSYFDRGDPAVGGAAAADGTQSLTFSQVSSFDSVKNRVTISESELASGGTFYGQVQLVCEGEPVANRDNNLRSDQLSFNWSGSSWSTSNQGGSVQGSVLNQWSGASVQLAGNGSDDGRFAVAVKVTPLAGGMWHYEYAVHNIDNNRGGATFRLPLTSAVNVSNVGFRDNNSNLLDQWTFSQTAGELTWTAPGGNALDWNSIYNFYFDCDTAPGSGGAVIDQARIGPGQLSVLVPADVPGGTPVATVTSVGTSCGDCTDTFYEFFGAASGMDLSGTGAALNFVSGQYQVGPSTAVLQAPSGTQLSLGDDSEAAVTLPFSLPYPGGSTTQLWVCSNGFISPGASNGTSWTPASGDLLGGNPRWAAGWHDLSPNQAGRVMYASSPSVAVVTWDAVENYSGTDVSTFQVQFYPNGDVQMLWQSMSQQGNAWLVGWSPGGGATDPGSQDLTTALPAGFNLCAGSVSGITLSTNARPILGTTVQQITSGIQIGTTFGMTAMSLVPAIPPIDLTSIGMEGCEAHLQGGDLAFFFNPAGTVQVPLSIPNVPAFSGLSVTSQSFTYNPPLTTLGFISSNAVVMVLGPQ
jgi:hypothetical protein